jgi:hypothetical protein
VANTVVWLMPKYSIAMHVSTWHCSIAKDAGGKDLCSNVVRVLCRLATSSLYRPSNWYQMLVYSSAKLEEFTFSTGPLRGSRREKKLPSQMATRAP